MPRWRKETTNFCASKTESVGMDDTCRRPTFVRVHSSTAFLKGNQHRLSCKPMPIGYCVTLYFSEVST